MKPHLALTAFVSLILAIPLQANPLDSLPKRRVEVGVNITYVLTNLLGNATTNTATDPYQVSLRVGGPNRRFRTALAVVVNRSENAQNGNFIDRFNLENNVQMRVGYEWVYPVHRLGGFYWGLDAVGEWGKTVNEITQLIGQNFVTAKLKGSRFGIGGGPVLGLIFKPHPRIAFTTETALYPSYRYTTQSVNAPPDIRQSTTTSWRLVPTLPTALFINLLF